MVGQVPEPPNNLVFVTETCGMRMLPSAVVWPVVDEQDLTVCMRGSQACPGVCSSDHCGCQHRGCTAAHARKHVMLGCDVLCSWKLPQNPSMHPHHSPSPQHSHARCTVGCSQLPVAQTPLAHPQPREGESIRTHGSTPAREHHCSKLLGTWRDQDRTGQPHSLAQLAVPRGWVTPPQGSPGEQQQHQPQSPTACTLQQHRQATETKRQCSCM